ncbi:putative bifunctional diguanylate cyclase/phosphodiesterase [Arthrobacter sp.]|uniref:putative bifunctional diguanylate cyclase/phosphodiesterase n=1 Tax=Arthrobacter sp. TaxID=1667 RepID=UPI003A905F69
MTEPSASADDRIGSIIEALIHIADGQFVKPLEPSASRDDVDAVMIGINAMAEELGATYEQLECRVRLRTQELAEARDSMIELAMTDHLTGLANRLQLERELERRLEALPTGGALPCVIAMDLDHFKEINDTLGHQAGDVVLKVVAQRLRASIRSADLIARLGGDEFAVLLADGAGIEDAEALCKRVLATLDTEFPVDQLTVRPGMSFGIALGRPDSTVGELMLEADTAMYQSKGSATSKVHVFRDHMLWARRRAAELIEELRTELEHGSDVVAYYQPIIDLKTGECAAAEALVRWEHKTRGTIMPAELLPLAHQAQQFMRLTEVMLSHALSDVASWRAKGLVDDEFRVSVNVDAEALADLRFVESLAGMLRREGVPGTCLSLEITEDLALSRAAEERYALKYLRKLGVRLSIDDFGTGYSSIGYLDTLPANSAKVDRSLIQGIELDSRKAGITASVLQLIAVSGLDSVAEGLETAEQVDAVTSMGFDYGQGFHFGRPSPAAEFEAHLEQQSAAGTPAGRGNARSGVL